MKRTLIAFALLTPVAFFASCKSTSCSTSGAAACGDCGVEKGGDDCCEAEAEHCGDCGEIKGSTDCCK